MCDHTVVTVTVTAVRGPFGLVRSRDDRVVSGVAAGLARRLGSDAVLVRLAFVVLATAGLFGVFAYLVGRALLPDDDPADPAPARPPLPRYDIALAVTTAGMLWALRSVGLWISDVVTWSTALAATGSGLVWARSSSQDRTRWTGLAARVGGSAGIVTPADRARLAAGAALVLAGIATFLVTTDGLAASADLLLGVVVALVGAALLAGPGVLRLARQAADERRERIRSEERAEMAAHLHDSVLQTLSLIQRTDDPAVAARLARSQERDLRTWLFGRDPAAAPAGLADALRDAAGRVEDSWDVAIEVVTVGDHPLDERLRAVVEATAEAMTNAAKHAGVPTVSVYAEVGPTAVEVFVRDEGCGFDPAGVADDRRGMTESIVGRMRRNGGGAVVHSTAGEGTEVELRLPLVTGSLTAPAAPEVPAAPDHQETSP